MSLEVDLWCLWLSNFCVIDFHFVCSLTSSHSSLCQPALSRAAPQFAVRTFRCIVASSCSADGSLFFKPALVLAVQLRCLLSIDTSSRSIYLRTHDQLGRHFHMVDLTDLSYFDIYVSLSVHHGRRQAYDVDGGRYPLQTPLTHHLTSLDASFVLTNAPHCHHDNNTAAWLSRKARLRSKLSHSFNELRSRSPSLYHQFRIYHL